MKKKKKKDKKKILGLVENKKWKSILYGLFFQPIHYLII